MKEIIEKLKNSERILITTHVNPDPDAIGSGLALYLALNKLLEEEKKVVRFVIQDNVPAFLDFLEHSVIIENFGNIQTKYKFDTVISVDCGSKDRIGAVSELITENSLLINIDHHASNKAFGDLNYLVPTASSTCEIMYDLIKEMGVEMTKDIAECLYSGIVGDTGNFAYSNVSKKTFVIASELVDLGINIEFIARNIYFSKTMPRMKILGLALNNFEFIEDKKLSYFFLSYEDMKKYNGEKEDSEGIVEAIRAYDGCDISLFLREEENGQIKGSLRSKEKDINHIAAIFNGGGHKKAAGFNTDKSKEEVLEIVINNI